MNIQEIFTNIEYNISYHSVFYDIYEKGWDEFLNSTEQKKPGLWARFKGSPIYVKILVILLILILVVLIAAGCVAYYLYSQVSEIFDQGDAGTLTQIVEEEDKEDIEANGARFYNLLMLGIDYDKEDDGRDYAAGKGNTDVILYVQVNRDTGEINVLQIPRDSYIGDYIAEGCPSNTGKINGVFANGPDQENLINNIANKVYDMFKLPVDNYLTIDMEAFRTMLNVMGGIQMYVPWDIVAVNKETGKEELLVPQGTHRVSGDTAEVILRNRNYAQADYKRLETQQYFYAAFVRTFLEEYKLADYYAACKNVAYYINTDLDIKEIWGLYATMTSVSASNIYIVRLPGGGYNYKTLEGVSQSGYALDRDAVAELLNEHFRSPDHQVDAERLNIPTDVEWLYGVTSDPGRYLGEVNNGGGDVAG